MSELHYSIADQHAAQVASYAHAGTVILEDHPMTHDRDARAARHAPTPRQDIDRLARAGGAR